ncbi:MAG TPA: hypothetical protein ENH85_09475 [Candidatus Scalindua sp.]|nr:hypothetical protein [Candidatus Scalindua sp.]
MRTAFFEELRCMMREDKSLFLVVADMGLGLVEPFVKEFPDRFLNVGIAEQNMIGISAGLCNTGFRPVCYTISNFLVHRCFEQIRNDICLHNYPVILVGTSTGFDNGKLGPTHQVIDDIGCLKTLPNIHIYSPSSVSSTRMVFREIMKSNSPAYVRIGKGTYDVNVNNSSTNHMVIKGSQDGVLIITYGNMLENCVEAADGNPDISVYCMNKIKPIREDDFKDIINKYSKIIVIEDHFAGSGLYNALCQYLVETGARKTELCSIAIPDCYEERVGDKNYFSEKYGFTPGKINEVISDLLLKWVGNKDRYAGSAV